VKDTGFAARLAISFLGLAAVFGYLATSIVSLHLDAGRREKLLDARGYQTPLAAPRGRIYDRTGRALALDVLLKNVCIDPAAILRAGLSEFVSRQLGIHLAGEGVTARKVRDTIFAASDKKYRVVAPAVEEETAERILRLRLPGVWAEDVSKRQYPLGRLASHVIGFSNAEGVGSAGIEQRYDAYLRGLPGLRLGEKDGRRREIASRRTLEAEAVPGANVHLTVDTTIQYYAERALDWGMTNFNPKAMWAIVEDVKTGEILAMASRPDYDLNEYAKSGAEERRNRPVAANIEPGSIFKVATVAGAIDAGVVETQEVFFCENGYWRDCPGRGLKDLHPYGDLDVGGILKKSSNVGAAKIAVRLGQDKFRRYLSEFGIGRKTGIELPGEESGMLHPLSKWTTPSISRVAMGHEVMVTALQMVNLLSCLGNDGYLMRPYIVSKVEDAEGRVLSSTSPTVAARPVTERTAREMRELLLGVTGNDGTGKRARIEGYPVGGKTGTAEKIVGGHYVRNSNVASFMGMFPALEPRVAIIVVADDPTPLHGGGAVSAPVFANMALDIARYLDIRAEDAAETVWYEPAGAGDEPDATVDPEALEG
jgi:cell division protein FtsI (penicillin-binding protein 3)